MLPLVVSKGSTAETQRKGLDVEKLSLSNTDMIYGVEATKEWTFTEMATGWLIGSGTRKVKFNSTSDAGVATYLNDLEEGTYRLTFVYTNGECSCSFEVKKLSATDSQATSVGDKSEEIPHENDCRSVIAAEFTGLLLISVMAVLLQKKKYMKKEKR